MAQPHPLDVTSSSATTKAPPSARATLEVAKLIDISRCIGCKACQAACMEWNDLRSPVGGFDGSYTNPPDLDDQTWCLMRFHEQEIAGSLRWLILKDGCLHCTDPGCLKACPSPGAVIRYSNGIVDFQQQHCIGCGYCISGCPFDIPRLRKEDSRVYKCTLCSDRVAVGLEPACIKSCPTQALSFGSKERMLQLADQRLVDLRERGFAQAAVYDPAGVGGTHVMFVLPHGDQPEAYGLPRNPTVSPVVELWRSTLARGLGVFTMFAVAGAGVLHYMRHGPLEVSKDGNGAPEGAPYVRGEQGPSHDRSGEGPPRMRPGDPLNDSRSAVVRRADLQVRRGAPSPDLIIRHGVGERVTHWALAMAFVALFLSGLALFHPFFFWLSSLFGGGQLMRALHPIAGVVFVALFYPYAARLWRDNRWLPADSAWVRHMWAFMRKAHHATDTGKYNAGQKLMFWSMVPLIAALFVTGLVVWQPWIAPYFPPVVRRFAGLLHAVAAFVMFVGIGVHWYAAYWTKGAIQAMVRGTVTREWAKFHHPAWYREVTGDAARQAQAEPR